MTTVYDRTLAELTEALGRGFLSKALKISPAQREKLNLLFDGTMGLTNFGQPYAFDATWATWFQKRATEPDDTFEAFKANYLTMSNFATGKNGRRGRYLILPVQNPDSSSTMDARAYEEWHDTASETASETSSVSSSSDDRIPHFYSSNRTAALDGWRDLYDQQRLLSPATQRARAPPASITNTWQQPVQSSSLSSSLYRQPEMQHAAFTHAASAAGGGRALHLDMTSTTTGGAMPLSAPSVSEQDDELMDVVADPLDADRPRFDYTIPMPPPEFYCNLGETAYWSDEMSSPSQSFQSPMTFSYDKWDRESRTTTSSSCAFYDAEALFDSRVDDDLWN